MKRSTSILALLVLQGVLLCAPIASSHAQGGSSASNLAKGILTGMVKDSAGHGIGSAMIIARHPVTKVETRVSALSNGRFALTGLELGVSYSITVASIGYEPTIRSDIVIPANALLRMDFTLDKDPTQTLEMVTVKAQAKGSKLSKKYLGGNEIREAKVHSALDAIMRLRPVMLAPDYDICITNDSLSLYVDGVRRPVYNPTDDGFGAMRTVTTQGRNRGTKQTTGYTNEEIVQQELAKIPVDEVFDIQFVSCDDWDPAIGKRNVIWVRSAKFALMQEKIKKERGW